MSRRCRASLQNLGSGGAGGGDLGVGCGCRGGAPEPCIEPVIYGSNILLDPSFEQFPGDFGLNTGPDAETFPGEFSPGATAPSTLFWAGGQILYDGPLPAWAVESNDVIGTDPENRLDISTASPNIGTYHGRFATNTIAGFNTENLQFFPLGFYQCSRMTDWSGAAFFKDKNGRPAQTALCQPGDLAVWSIVAKASVTTDTPELELGVDSAQSDFSTANQWPSFAFPTFSLTTSYVRYEFAFFLPAEAYYMAVSGTLSLGGTLTTKTVFDIDDATLSLVATGTGLLLCAFASLITIDNSVTETDFL